MTFSMRYYTDYNNAWIPTFPSRYGYKQTRLIIALSSVGAAASFVIGAAVMGIAAGYIGALVVLSLLMLGLAVISILKPSEKVNFGLFKFASIYMLSAMIMIVIGMI